MKKSLEQQILDEIMKDDTVKYMSIPNQTELPKRKRPGDEYEYLDDDFSNNDERRSITQSQFDRYDASLMDQVVLDLAPVVRKAAPLLHEQSLVQSRKRQEVSKGLQQAEYSEVIRDYAQTANRSREPDASSTSTNVN